MSSRTLPVHLPFKTLEALGEFTGKWCSDTYKLEPFVCQAIDNFVKQAPQASCSETPSRKSVKNPFFATTFHL